MGKASERIFDRIAVHLSAEGQPFLFAARGKSMSPFIRDGDTVVISPLSRKPRTGDVVLLNHGQGLFLHRVIARTHEGVVTRGDACRDDDGFFPYDQIVGRAVGVQGGGYNFHLRCPAGFLIAVSLGLRKFPVLFRAIRKIARFFL